MHHLKTTFISPTMKQGGGRGIPKSRFFKNEKGRRKRQIEINQMTDKTKEKTDTQRL
jgi:hypothetical protein